MGGEEMQQAYDSDKLIKKLLKEDFRKRNRKHRKSLKNNTNPIKIIITTLGLISLIYAATFIIMKSAEKTEIRKLTIQSAKNTEPNDLKTKEYEPDLEKINEENWKTKKKCKILHKQEVIVDTTENTGSQKLHRNEESNTSNIQKERALKYAIENSITTIMNTHECSEIMAKK